MTSEVIPHVNPQEIYRLTNRSFYRNTFLFFEKQSVNQKGSNTIFLNFGNKITLRLLFKL